MKTIEVEMSIEFVEANPNGHLVVVDTQTALYQGEEATLTWAFGPYQHGRTVGKVIVKVGANSYDISDHHLRGGYMGHGSKINVDLKGAALKEALMAVYDQREKDRLLREAQEKAKNRGNTFKNFLKTLSE